MFGAALQFGPLLVLDPVHVVAAETRVTHDGVVDHPRPALTNRAEGQFGLKRPASDGQVEAARALLSPPTWATGPTAATDPFTQMIKAWTEAFTRFSGERTADPRSS